MNARWALRWHWCFSLMMMAGATSAQEPTAKIPQVPVVQPVHRQVSDYELFSGRTEAASRVDLRCRVSGYLVRAAVPEGADVKQGELLFEIDPRPYRAEMDRADATVGLAEARLKLAENIHKRALALQGKAVIGQDEFNKIVAERAEAEAGVRVAKAGRDAARLNLEYTRVLAPIAGRIGRRLIDPGNLVRADETRLAVIVSREPMYVTFDVDERLLLRLMRSLRDGGKGEKMAVDIALADDNGFPLHGVVDFVDNLVDPATGSLRLRAVVGNKDGLLTPGMLVRIRMRLGSPHEALLLPARAVMVDEGERFVFVVNDDNVLGIRPVKLGQKYDGLHAVKAGLKAEDRVVIGGLQRLRPGMTVQPRLEKLPDNQATDSPEDAGWSAAPLPRGSSGPGILVEAVYPGASAAVVSENVRGPLEEMVGGIEKLRRMRSRCTSDGKLAVALTFNRDVDLQRIQALTQNRVNQALPLLPDAVKQASVSVTQGTAGVLLIINLSSPDDSRDNLYLSNYASIQLKDELARIAGVGETKLIGHGEYALRVWVDPARLAERKLNAGEVSRLLAKEKDAGVADREKLENLILKVDDEGRMIRLRDVASVELGAGGPRSEALLDGKPSVALVIYETAEANSKETRATLRKRLAELRARLPQGLALEEIFDFTAKAAEYLLLDLDVPTTAAARPTEKILSRCAELLQAVPGVEHVLALSENAFDLFGSGPSVLVRLTPAEQRKIARDKVIDSIRARLAAFEDATIRIRDLSRPGSSPDFRYPIDLALSGPEVSRVRAWAIELGERLERSKKLTDVWVNRDAVPRAHRFVEIDREAAATRGVPLTDIKNTLQVYLGAHHVGDFNAFGRKWRVEVQAITGRGDWATGLRQLKIRNSRGQMIPVNTLLKVRETTQPLALHFIDGWPMVELTANAVSGVSLEQGRKLCEAAADEARNDLGLGATYRLTWLQDK